MGHGHAGRAPAVVAPALVALLALAVAGCGGSPGPASSPTDPLAARAPLTSCGTVDLGQGEAVPETAWDCLDQATDAGAELVVSTPTTEGDPIVTYYRVGPGIDGLEVYVDNRADRFAGVDDRGVTRQLCPATTTAQDPAGCREVALDQA